ncbi:hypothetical protein D9619_012983 [Psilocybe cf. subviscida]|uniref:Uncharacterized protein n=1 Tax=Psilocybe cf. subviscida TaxID=2480587 RepID=A0A8H5BI59_9AGAR|nr:hypothetical protein D9619_012983 [Psilocybe cf. subviscida]
MGNNRNKRNRSTEAPKEDIAPKKPRKNKNVGLEPKEPAHEDHPDNSIQEDHETGALSDTDLVEGNEDDDSGEPEDHVEMDRDSESDTARSSVSLSRVGSLDIPLPPTKPVSKRRAPSNARLTVTLKPCKSGTAAKPTNSKAAAHPKSTKSTTKKGKTPTQILLQGIGTSKTSELEEEESNDGLDSEPEPLKPGIDLVSCPSCQVRIVCPASESGNMAIPCIDVKVKPTLSYKLESASARSPFVSLESSDDWRACIRNIEDSFASKKKKSSSALVTVTIELGPQNYLESLRARYNKKSTSSAGARKGRKQKPVLLDLDGEDGDLDLSDSGKGGTSKSHDSYDFHDRRREQLEALERAHVCQICGPNVACMIDKFGSHISLSMPQKSGWASALASKTTGVTLRIPPKTPLFEAFHSSLHEPPTTSAAPSQQPSYGPYSTFPGHPGMMMHGMWPPGPQVPPFFPFPQMYAMPPYQYVPAPPPAVANPLPTPTPVPIEHPQPGTGLPDRQKSRSLQSNLSLNDSHEYPSLESFFRRLAEANPNRAQVLTDIVESFTSLDILTLPEIASFDCTTLRNELKLSLGNANFILKEVASEMKKVKHNTKSSKN